MAYFNTTDDYRLYFDEFGNKELPAIIFTYDIGGKRSFFKKQIEGLKDSFRVITWDYRGCGAADHVHSQMNTERIAYDLSELMEQLGLEKAVLAGSGFGSAVILNYIRIFGESKVDRVILMDPSLKDIKDDTWQYGRLDNKKAAIDLMKRMTYGWDKFAPELMNQMFGSGEQTMSEKETASVKELFLKNSNAMMMPLMVAYITEDNRETASNVKCPVLVTAGGNRDSAYSEAMKRTAEVFSEGEYCELNGGTLHYLTDSEQFNQKVKEFCGK